MLAEIVKAALIPGSMAFLLLGLAAGVGLLYLGKSGQRLGRRWLTLLATLYAVLALPAVSNALIAGLEPDFPSVLSRDDARGARVVVVVGNGVVTYSSAGQAIHQFARRTAFAVLEGARIYTLIAPDIVIASGGIPSPSSQQAPESDVIRDELVRQGVPLDRIVLESSSRNTSEQMENVARIVRERALPGPIVLVTTPAHSRRALMLANQEGLDVVPSMADALRYDQDAGGWRNWVPTIGALRGSESTTYEYLAVVYDWIRNRRTSPSSRGTRRMPPNPHPRVVFDLEQRVDEGRDGGAGEEHHGAERQHDEHERSQPPLARSPEQVPEIRQDASAAVTGELPLEVAGRTRHCSPPHDWRV